MSSRKHNWKHKPSPRKPQTVYTAEKDPILFPIREIVITDVKGKLHKFKFKREQIFKFWKDDSLPIGGLSLLKSHYNTFESLLKLMDHCRSVVERPIIKHSK